LNGYTVNTYSSLLKWHCVPILKFSLEIWQVFLWLCFCCFLFFRWVIINSSSWRPTAALGCCNVRRPTPTLGMKICSSKFSYLLKYIVLRFWRSLPVLRKQTPEKSSDLHMYLFVRPGVPQAYTRSSRVNELNRTCVFTYHWALMHFTNVIPLYAWRRKWHENMLRQIRDICVSTFFTFSTLASSSTQTNLRQSLLVNRVCLCVCNARYVSTVAPPSDSKQSVVLAHYAEVHYENTVPLEAPHD